MKMSRAKRFDVPAQSVVQLMEVVERYSVECLMDNGIVTRFMYLLDPEGEKKWVRVLVGDNDLRIGRSPTLTYKKSTQENGEGDVEQSIVISLTTVAEGKDLLEQLGVSSTSEQETRRIKHVCNYRGRRIQVTVDQWPWLDNRRAVKVEDLDHGPADVVDDFLEVLGLENMPRYSGGVDVLYTRHLRITISTEPLVKFSLDCPVAQNLESGA